MHIPCTIITIFNYPAKFGITMKYIALACLMIALMLIFFYCNRSLERKGQTRNIENDYPKDNFGFIGDWQNSGEDGIYFESW